MEFPLVTSTIKISGKTLYVDHPFQGAASLGMTSLLHIKQVNNVSSDSLDFKCVGKEEGPE